VGISAAGDRGYNELQIRNSLVHRRQGERSARIL